MNEEKTTAQYLMEDAAKLRRYDEMAWAISWAATQLTEPLWYPSDKALEGDNSATANHLRNLSRFRRILHNIEEG